MKRFMPLALLALALAALSPAAHAQPQSATTAKPVNLRAGPARDFPVVAVLPAGLVVSVQGCLPDYRWCDVIAGYNRGWVYAGNLNYFYQGRYAPLPNYAPIIGLVVLSFMLDDYWGHHYVDRPWYRERHRWEGRTYPAPAPAPRVHPRAAPPAFVPGPAPRPAPAPAPRIRSNPHGRGDHGDRAGHDRGHDGGHHDKR
jgi:uncharacterized protein YraI